MDKQGSRLKGAFIYVMLFLNPGLYAQVTDYDQVVLPLENKARDFSEYLVQLAWMNNPESAIAEDDVRNAKDQAKNTRKEWIRDANATFNLNEGNLRASDSSANVFFPRYNFGVTLNVFHLITQPTKNKIGARNVRIAEHKVHLSKLELRSKTLSRYAKFKAAKEVLKMRILAEQEFNSAFTLIEQLYKTDDRNLDEYTTAAGQLYQAKESRIKAEADLMVAKLELEEIIGLRWEQIQHPSKEE